MKFGVCGDTNLAAIASRESYDYMEWSVPSLLKPSEPDSAFEESLRAIESVNMRYPVCNGFVPGDLKITGPDVDISALQEYVTIAMRRAERAKVEVIVFGSGGARRIPDGFDPKVANKQLVAFCRMVAPLAYNHGVTIVVEPLNKTECNVLTTVAECAKLVNEVEHPRVRLLVDAYHLMHDNDSYEDIVTYGNLLAHAHIATVPNRLTPGAEPCDFSQFFSALAKANYTGRISVEARLSNPEIEIPAALPVMRKFASLAAESD